MRWGIVRSNMRFLLLQGQKQSLAMIASSRVSLLSNQSVQGPLPMLLMMLL